MAVITRRLPSPSPLPAAIASLLRARRLVQRNAMVYRHSWVVIVSGFFEPLFYLLGIGFGLGSLIGTVAGPDGSQIPYAVFVAPALLATASMNGAVYDGLTNVFFKLRYGKVYDAMLATPMSPTVRTNSKASSPL